MREYETVIGLEVHVELATKTKIFCGCSTAFGARPNTQICPVCSGQPGTLPVLNRRAVELALMVGLALKCDITRESRFDRKNYFYPDNPQNYQISQLYLPIARNGFLDIGRPVRIHEMHMEEDAGKLFHDRDTGETLVDYNRSGVPLVEIVTEPDMGDAGEVLAFLEKLRLLIRYLGASDCKLQEGSMRVDVNLSVRPLGEKEMGTRTEMKNLNSFRAISAAIESERARQIQLLEAEETVEMETRRWDEDRNQSFSMRAKEDSRDYRYFPEPDLPPLAITEEMLHQAREAIPELREERRARYKATYELPQKDIDLITESRRMSDLFEKTISLGAPPRKVANWLIGETMRLLRERCMDPEEVIFSAENLAKLIDLVEKKTITGAVAKEVFEVMFESNTDPEEYVRAHGLETKSDEGTLRNVIAGVLRDNPTSVADYLGGKEKAIGYLVGCTMKIMKGQADPTLVKELLTEQLRAQ